MTEFVEQCRHEWRRLGVPNAVANEMAAELETDLEEAESEGVPPEEVVGGTLDARSFAESWAAERRVGRSRVRRAVLFAALATCVALAISGAVLTLSAPSSHAVRAAGPVTLQLPRTAPPPNPSAVTAVWVTAAPPALVSSSDDYTRTLGVVLLLVGAGGMAATGLFSLWRRSTAF